MRDIQDEEIGAIPGERVAVVHIAPVAGAEGDQAGHHPGLSQWLASCQHVVGAGRIAQRDRAGVFVYGAVDGLPEHTHGARCKGGHRVFSHVV